MIDGGPVGDLGTRRQPAAQLGQGDASVSRSVGRQYSKARISVVCSSCGIDPVDRRGRVEQPGGSPDESRGFGGEQRERRPAPVPSGTAGPGPARRRRAGRSDRDPICAAPAASAASAAAISRRCVARRAGSAPPPGRARWRGRRTHRVDRPGRRPARADRPPPGRCRSAPWRRARPRAPARSELRGRAATARGGRVGARHRMRRCRPRPGPGDGGT